MSYVFTPIDLDPLRSQVADPEGLTWAEIDTKWTKIQNAINAIGAQLQAQQASQFVTGMPIYIFSTTTPSGWLYCQYSDTIGGDASGSTYLGSVYFPLYEVLWAVSSNGDLLTSGGAGTIKGVSAAADWAANKRVRLPDATGRGLVNTGIASGGALDRVMYSRYGAESFTDSRVYTITNIAVTGSVPALTIPALTVTLGSVTAAMTNSTISVGGGVLSGQPSNNLAVSAVTGGVLSGAPGVGSLAVSAVTIGGSGTVNVTGAVCVNVAAPDILPVSVIDCSSPLVVSVSSIAAGLTPGGGVLSGAPDAGTLAVTPAGGGVLSGGVTIGSLAVSAVTASIADPSITVGGSASTIANTTSVTALTGVTASGATIANPLTVLLSPPQLVARLLIKI